MNIFHLITSRITPILFTLLITLQITACGSGDSLTSTDTPTENNPAASGINLSWVAPTEREDGSNLSVPEIAEYKISYRVAQTQDSNSITIADCYAVCSTFINLDAGIYHLSLTTIDTEGRESQPSEEVSIVVS